MNVLTSRSSSAALLLTALLAVFLVRGAAAQVGGPLPTPLPLFPADNWWNVDVSAAPLAPQSAALINFIGTIAVSKYVEFSHMGRPSGGDELGDI